MGIRASNVFMSMKRSIFLVGVLSLLVVGCSNNPDLGGNGGNNGGNNGGDNAGGNVILGADGITISLPGWEQTRAYSLYDLTTPDLNVGEEVFVLDEDGERYVFSVAEELVVDDADNAPNDAEDSEGGKYGDEKVFVLKSSNTELIDGKRYRVQYPAPGGGESEFIIFLAFGGYDNTPSLDWMVSGWQEFDSDKPCHFDLKRINCALVFDVVAPFDAHIEEMRLVCEDSAMFCIKGAFDGRPDDLYPERTTWASQLLFPYKNETWKQGEHYSFIITLWPYEFGTKEYTFEIYTSDDRSAIVPISIPNMSGGQIVEYQIGESEFEVAPLSYKDVIVADREGYEITGSYVTDGNGFVN